MSAERRERTAEILEGARRLAPDERKIFLERECRGDESLRAEVEALLGGAGVDPDFLDPLGGQAVDAAMKSLELDYSGRRMGDFLLERPIGRGATGVVHEATQVSLKRTVAVKVLSPMMVSNAERLERFRREAYSQSRLRHPYVAAAFYFGSEGGPPYLAMERVRGKSLREHMVAVRKLREEPGGNEERPRFDPFDPRTAAELMAKVTMALEYCHRQGVIHRDIKPNNILIDERLDPRLIDFGIARDQSLETLTRTSDVSGTPYYMSPEQVRARKQHISHRTDIYSAGAVLYEMLTGEPPFPGTDSLSVLHSICHDELKPVRSLNGSVPQALARICHKAMEKEPEHRYRTAGELGDDLRAFLAGRRVAARNPAPARRITVFVARHPLAAALFVLLLSATWIAIESRRGDALAAEPPILKSLDGNTPQQAGLPVPVYQRLSQDEKRRAYDDYIKILMNAMPDTPPPGAEGAK